MKGFKMGELIKKLREAKEFSQLELADRLNVCNSTICQIEKNKRNVSFERLEQIAGAFDLDTEVILLTWLARRYPNLTTPEFIEQSVLLEDMLFHDSSQTRSD